MARHRRYSVEFKRRVAQEHLVDGAHASTNGPVTDAFRMAHVSGKPRYGMMQLRSGAGSRLAQSG